MPNLKQSIEMDIVDENGVIKSSKTNRVISWGDEPQFIKLYLQDILYLSDLPKGHEKILFELLKRANYAGKNYGMEITLNAAIKRRIAKELNLDNIRSINNVLSDLVKGRVLSRVDTGVYALNPYLFGKGDWQDISRLRLQINYDSIKGKTFNAVCEYDNKKKKDKTKHEKKTSTN